jgi:hypothetical protein
MKMVVNQAYSNMGLATTQMLGIDRDEKVPQKQGLKMGP